MIQRNGYFYYYRRVPKHLAPIEPREHIKISLRTRDKALARKRALIHNESTERYWRELGAAPTIEDGDQYRAAVQTARLHGFVYRDIIDLSANAELTEVVNRLLALRDATPAAEGNSLLRDALLGTASRPEVLLSQAFDIYRPRCVDRLSGKSDLQIRKWENPRRLAIENFIRAVGDKPIADVCRKDVLAFQDWWIARIRDEGIRSATANKQLRQVRDILSSVVIACELSSDDADVHTMFAKIQFLSTDGSRRSFEASYVQDVLLTGDALDGMNNESRALVYLMADTGARVSEISGLLAEDIRLDTRIPFIHIRANEKRDLKTPSSERKIPLVGAALFAAQQFPDGLSRYSSADSASSQVNKYLRENRLNPTKQHSLYSLRHTFKDRLRDVQAPEEVIDNLMGHKSRGPKYGRGHILETKLEWLERIAYDASEITWV